MSSINITPNNNYKISMRANNITSNSGDNLVMDASGNSNLVIRTDSSNVAVFGPNTIAGTTYNTSLNVNGTYFSNGISALLLPADVSANRPIAGQPGYLRYDTNLNLLEFYNNLTWIPIVSSPFITSFTPTTVTQSGQTITINGINFFPGGTVSFIDTSNNSFTSGLTTFISFTQITATTPTPALSVTGQPFIVRYTGPYGGFGQLSGLNTGSAPIFTNAAGSIGNIFTNGASTSSYSLLSCSATDPEGDTITYSISAGSLPTGLSINSSGVITGTMTAVPSSGTAVTYNFTVSATTASATSTRQFSIVVYGQVTQNFTYTGSNQTFTRPSGLQTLTLKMWGAGGGSGITDSASKCGGGGGFISGSLNMTSYSSLIVVVGKGGTRSLGSYPPNIDGGSGGGYAGIFNGSVTIGNTIAIAGGGGGGAGSFTLAGAGGFGGAGGGLTGGAGENDTRIATQTGGQGGTQVAGGAAGSNAFGAGDQTAGSALQGGQGSGANNAGGGGQTFPTPKVESQQYGGGGVGGASTVGNWSGGGGGGGYYGGGGGAQGYSGGGGGGSSYIGGSGFTATANVQGSSGATSPALPGGSGDSAYVAGIGRGINNGTGGNAYIVITY